MANRYWVGGTGSWNSSSTTNWSSSSGGASGASAPTSADDVFFDANSNVGTGSFTVTTSTGAICRSITVSGLDGAMTLAGSGTLEVRGNLTFPSSNLTYTRTGELILASSITSTITTNGVSLSTGAVTVNTTGASTTTLGSSLTCGNFTVTDGTFSTANFSLTCAVFSSSNSNTRSITLGTSTVTCNGTWFLSTTTNLTFSGASSEIVMANNSNFLGGGLTYNIVRFPYNGAFTVICIISGANTFSSLRLCDNTKTVIQPQIFQIRATQTCTTDFICRTTAANSRVLVIGDDTSSTQTISTPVATLQNVDFGYINAAGSAAPFTGTRIGDLGGNVNITTSAPKTVYWNLAAGGNYSSTAWATSSGGTPNADNFPLPQDTAVLENTGLNAGATITLTALFNGIDTSTRTNSATLSSSGTIYCYGTVYNFSSANVTFPNIVLYFCAPTTQQVWLPTASNNFITQLNTYYSNSVSSYDPANLRFRGTLKFMNSGRLAASNVYAIQHYAGTIDVNGQTIDMPVWGTAVRLGGGSSTNFLHWNFNGGTVDFTGSQNSTIYLIFYDNALNYHKFDSVSSPTGGFRAMPTGAIAGAYSYLRIGSAAIADGAVPPNIECRSVTSLSGNSRFFYFVDLSFPHINNLTTSITAAADSGSSGPYILMASNLNITGNFTICRRTIIPYTNLAICFSNGVGSLASQSNIAIESNSSNVFVSQIVYFGYDTYYAVTRANTNYVVSQSTTTGTGFNLSSGIFYTFGGTLNLNGNRINIDRLYYGSGSFSLVSGTGGTIVSNYTNATTSNYAWSVNTSNFSITGNVYLQCAANNSTSFNVLNSTNTGLSINRSAGTGNIFISGNVRDYANTATAPVPSNSFNLYGNLTMPAGGSSTSGIAIFFTGGDTQTITTNGANCNFAMQISKTAGTKVILAQNTTVSSSGYFYLYTGELDLNNFNLTIQTTGGIRSQAGGLKRIYLGSGTITATYIDLSNDSADVTVTPGTSTIIMSNGASSTSFFGGGKTYNVLRKVGSGTLTITGSNTFATIENDKTGTQGTISFQAAQTQTITSSFDLSGNASSTLTLNSATSGSQGTLYMAPDTTINENYLSIRDLNATGTKYWYAGNNSTNVSNNTNWIFCSSEDQNFSSFFS